MPPCFLRKQAGEVPDILIWNKSLGRGLPAGLRGKPKMRRLCAKTRVSGCPP